MKIVGISGKKQSGKTTAEDFLLRKLGDKAFPASFADTLKRIVCKCFGADPLNLFGGTDKQKDKILPCGKSGREVLQIVGTDWFRSLDPDCWIRAYNRELEFTLEHKGENTIIITPDVRFPNEVKCIQDLGGHVIRLLRAPFPDDKHKSETALDNIEKLSRIDCPPTIGTTDIRFDAIIDNQKMTIAEQNEAVWKLVKEKKWI